MERRDWAPTFLGLGSQRCGSTWLYGVLDKHPQIQMARRKEADFFNREVLNRDLSWYQSLFEPEKGRARAALRGEISPVYARMKPRQIRAVARLNPRMRLLLTIRNPLERDWSQAQFELGFSRSKLNLEALSDGRYLRYLERSRTTQYSDYATTIDRWQAVFGKGSVHVDTHDNLEQDPRGFVHRVLQHVGATTDWQAPELKELQALLSDRVNATQSAVGRAKPTPEVVLWYLAQKWLPRTRKLNARLDGMLDSWVAQMEDICLQSRPGWRVRALMTRYVASLPDKLAYAGFDRWRDLRIVQRYRRFGI